MFDQTRLDDLKRITLADLDSLPEEDDRHEYKSSLTPDKKLGDEICKAASAFWNSGGGLLVAGVSDGDRKPDGGVSSAVGRQSRRDWVDGHVMKVTPPGGYAVHCVEAGGGKCVLLVGFARSNGGPHQAPDHRYYVRAGGRSEPAVHFLFEAIAARRAERVADVRHVLRKDPTQEGLVQLAFHVFNGVPAYDVAVYFDSVPETVKMFLPSPDPFYGEEQSPLRVAVLSPDFPIVFPFAYLHFGGGDEYEPVEVVLSFRDAVGERHERRFTIDMNTQLVQ